MPYQYLCDDCGAPLGKYNNVASQLDMTGHAYCFACYPKHQSEREPTIYQSTYNAKEEQEKDANH